MPDAQVVTALVDVFAKKGNMAMAMKVFQQMFREDNGLVPDEVNTTIITSPPTNIKTKLRYYL